MLVQIFASSACTGVVWTISVPNISNSSAALEPELSPTPADDARQRRDLLEEVVLGDPLRHVRDEQVLADAEAAPLLDVAGHPLGGARRDGRAEDQRVALAQHRQQVVDHAAHVRDVDLDVHVRRRVEGQHDVVGARGVLDRARQLEPAADSTTRSSSSCVPVSRERHLARRELVEHGLLALDPDRVEPAIGERQREWQADTAEADDGDARFHPRRVYVRRLRYWRANASTKRGLK